MRSVMDGRSLAYDDTGGPGIPLVLVHGFPLDRSIWAAQVRGLADVARVVALDLRGFGGSEAGIGADPSAPETMSDHAADIAGLLYALGIGKAVVAGVSMGGYVAMAFHREFPGLLRGLVLVDTSGGHDSGEARQSRDAAAALARAGGTAAVAGPMLPKMLTPENAKGPMGRSLLGLMSAQSVAGVVGALAAMRDRPESWPSLRDIEVPVLVITGAEDTLVRPGEAHALREAIPGARLEVIPGAAHLPNLERPEEFNRVLRGFLGTIA